MRTADPAAASTADAPTPFEAHPRLVWLLATACGLAVANLYYSQPLLVDIAKTFSANSQEVGLVATLTQVGYAAGMLLFLPLADLFDRRRLIVALLLAVSAATALAALSPTLGFLVAASLLIGLTTVAPQVIIPLSASLARPHERGRIIGNLYTGLLLGILLARTVSGTLGHALGWRGMFWVATGLMLALAAVLRVGLPPDRPHAGHRYREILRSLWTLVRTQPDLRRAALVGGGIFGAFSAFWTTLVFFLAGPPYGYDARAAGLFGLIGAAGALVVPAAGRWADRAGPHRVRGLALLATVASFAILYLGASHLAALVVAVLLLDAGVQAAHVCNQTQILGLVPNAHGRINTIYMIAYFGGGSLGSLLAATAWARFGWAGVCAVGAGFTLLALACHLRPEPAARPARSVATPNPAPRPDAAAL